MQRKLPPDPAGLDMAPPLVKKLNLVLKKIQEKIAREGGNGHSFALIHLVEGLTLEEWQNLAARFDLRGWLALPLSESEGVPLETLSATLKEITRQRDHDFLTGIANRRLFDRLGQSELQRALRMDFPLSFVVLDIDDFKMVNDTYGHLTGDKVLVALADLLTRSLRLYDLAARIGGEEFCLLLPAATTLQAADLANRILVDFSAIAFEGPQGEVFHCTFSAGVSTSRNLPGRKTLEDLLGQADALLYDAKRQGKNRVYTLAARKRVSENPALVQVAEKQFLFTGKQAQ